MNYFIYTSHRRCLFINEEIKEKMAKRDQAHKIARETGALKGPNFLQSAFWI